MSKALIEKEDFENDLKKESHKARRSIMLFLLSAITLGFNTFHIKLTSKLFPQSFSPNSFMAWRSVCVFVVSIVLIRQLGITVKPIREINNKFWFFQRTLGNYFSFYFFISCMLYLRASTASCFNSMYPPVVLIFSIFILKEKFHTRYLIGLLLCICGAFLIILNERPKHGHPITISDNTYMGDNVPLNSTADTAAAPSEQLDYLSLVKGTSFGCVHVLIVSLNIIANKIVGKELSHVEQCYYLGISNIIMGVSSTLFAANVENFNPFYFFFAFLNGFIFYIATYLMNESFKGMELSKLTPMSYLNTLTVFFLGVLFLNESFNSTDILGSLCIISFNLFNALNPIK
jgi:drug/metabolite transporter (DMT)-like permease